MEHFFDEFCVMENPNPCRSGRLPYTEHDAETAMRFHRSLPGYQKTELVSLRYAAERFDVDSVFVKDESSRFGLKAFKGLGGSYCMFRILCEKLGLDETTADYSTFLREDIRKACAQIEFVTATDGNHGKGVSWAAGLFGCKAHVFMPGGSVEVRRQAIEDAGNAVAEITEMNYDETVQYAAFLAEKNGWILIQDTSWEGYEKIPGWIIEGYLTMAAEAAEQMDGKRPTHLFLQAGVGAMAGGIASFFLSSGKEAEPVITIVEPKEAACIYQSVSAGDGKVHPVAGNPVTIMAGLNCGTPCGVVWPVIRDYADLFCACDDSVTKDGMRAYADPEKTDSKVISGESGAVTYGLLRKILKSEQLRELFRIDCSSVILMINTEGDTDPDGYSTIIQNREDGRE